jgi:hypothetical protein
MGRGGQNTMGRGLNIPWVHGILTPLPLVYRIPYPWYIEPPTNGISNPLPMVYQTPYYGIMNPPSFGKNEGFNLA